MSLVLGLLSLFCCVLPAIPAIICGFLAMGSIKKGSLSSAHRGKALAGIICGISSVILWTILLFTGVLQRVADRGDEMPPNTSQLPASPLPLRPLGSDQVLLQALESHVRALAVAKKESTDLRKKILTEESVTRTQERLDPYVFAITVVVDNVEFEEFTKCAHIVFELDTDLTRGGYEEGIYFPIRSVDIKMSKAKAANIKQGSRLVIQGRILVGQNERGDGLEGLRFSYKKAEFAITEYTCCIID